MSRFSLLQDRDGGENAKKGLLTQHPFCTQHAGYFFSGAEWKAQPPQEAQLPPHVPIPLLWSCTMVYTETRTNKRITSPTMSVPIRINSFALHCNSYRIALLIILQIDFNCTLIFFCGTQQEIKENGKDHSGKGCTDGKDPCRKEHAKLIENQGNGIGKTTLITDGKERPFAVVHFAADGSHGSNAGRAQKVEDEEGIGTEGTEVLGKGTPEFFTVLGGFCKTVEDTEGSYEVFLGNKARKGGDSGFPITPAEGAKIQATFSPM